MNLVLPQDQEEVLLTAERMTIMVCPSLLERLQRLKLHWNVSGSRAIGIALRIAEQATLGPCPVNMTAEALQQNLQRRDLILERSAAGLTIKQIAEELGLSYQRVQYIRSQALKRERQRRTLDLSANA